MDKQNKDIEISISDAFYDEIKVIILSSRAAAVRSVDYQRVMMYWRLP